MKIKTAVFNHFYVNTYLLVPDNGESVIIDPACQSSEEEKQLLDMIRNEQAKPIHMLLTHGHIDHIQGCGFLKKQFPDILLHAHPDCLKDYRRANSYAEIMGFPQNTYPAPDRFLQTDQPVVFGNDTLEILHTPGHAKGSVCLLHRESHTLFSGDTLFCQSVGRTDLPGGSPDDLVQSLKQLALLPAETKILPGHGEPTDLYFETMNNPYFSL